MDQISQFSIKLPQPRKVSAKLSSALSMPHISSVHRQKARIERVVKNATNSKSPDISDKHLADVANYIQENYNCAPQLTVLYDCLITRLSKKTDLASFKSHYLFHSNIFSDTGIHPAYRYSSWNIFVNKYVILPNLEVEYRYSSKHEASPLVIAYNRYLNQRLLDYARLKSDIIREERYSRKNSAGIGGASQAHMLKNADSSLLQIRLILDCMLPPNFANQPLLLSVYNLLAVDLSILFSVVCDCLVALLGNFSALIRTDAERTLFLYKEFSQLQIPQEVRVFTDMAPNMVNTENLRLPTELNQSPENVRALTKSLEHYLFQDLHVPETTVIPVQSKLSPPSSPFSPVSSKTNGTSELIYAASPTLSSMSSPLMVEKFDDTWASDILSTMDTTPDTSATEMSTPDTSTSSIEHRKHFVLAPPPRRRKKIPTAASNDPWMNFDFT